MVQAKELRKYDFIVGYGIGQNYEQLKHDLQGRISFSYLADKKWESTDIREYDGIPVIHLQVLRQLRNALVILFPRASGIRDVIKRELAGADIEICYINELFLTEYSVRSNDLIKQIPETKYCDEFGNQILFDETLPPNIMIYFWGKNNLLVLGSNLSVNRLDIHFGNNAFCTIGDGTSIMQTAVWVSDASLKIGKDCMLSSDIVIRTHDDHHIFDAVTHDRINIAKDVMIENQVWIGYGAVLLAGAHIGKGSIVGARAVTSSSFGDHLLIAGCPAKVIRENVCWSRDNTAFFQRKQLEECIDQNALKYL